MKFLGSREVRIAFLVLALVALLVPGAAHANTGATDFYTLPAPNMPPCRLYDSRQPAAPTPPAPAGVLPAGGSRTVTVNGFCGVPAEAVAVALNVTVAETTASGNLSLYPNGVVVSQPSQPSPQVAVASLSFKSGVNQGKILVVELGASGDLVAQNNSAGPLHFIIDVSGYFVDGPPVAVDDNYAAEKNTPLNVNAATGVISNDTLNGGSILSYGASTGGEQTTIGAATPTSAGGSIVLNADGSFAYSPPAGAIGIDDTFKYILQNPGGTSTATVTIGVGKASQTISFTSTAPSGATVGGATYAVTATATSGLPVTFTIDATATSVCSISGSTVSFIGVGTCVINADQAGDVNYNPAPQVQQSFAVGKGDQTIAFTSIAPSDAKVGGPTYNVTATASSGLTVAFTIDPSASSVCSIAGSTVSFLSVGTCVINANQAGDANYNPAPQVQQSFAVGKGSQTITFTSTAPAGATVNGPTYNVTATASSGLPVTFTIDASATSVCSIAGSTVSFTASGTCVINANQAGNANYDPAPQVQQSFAVGKTSQTISFTSTAPVNAKVSGPTYTVTATATSGLTVTFTIDATASTVCSIAGSTVSFIGVGTCVINANQAGDANYNAAPQVQQSFPVSKNDQTITFTSSAPAGAKVGGPTYAVTATATSGLTVAFTIDASAASVCTITGSTVSFIGVGTCVVNANQAGDANYNAAPQVQQSFLVGKGDQTIAFTSTAPINAKVGGPTYNVTATASSGLPVTITIDASAASVCSISGSTVSFIGAGTCVINANQAGNANFNAAPQVQQSFAVAKGDQTISFTSTPPAGATAAGPTYAVTATATSGLAVVFTIDASASSVCTISGSTVSFIGGGNCVINANQPGNGNWNAAPQVQQSFPVVKQNQTISFTSSAPVGATVAGPTYTVSATATSGLPVTFTIDASAASVCTIASSTVSFIGAGTCVINANQAGNAAYNAAPQVQQSFLVVKQNQTITITSTPPVLASIGGPTYTVTATATSGLPVTFTIDASAATVCTISGSTVSFTGGGTCLINANQAGNGTYNPAPQVQQSFPVNFPPQFTTNPVSYTTPGNTQLHVAGATLPGVASWSDPSGLFAKSGPTDPDSVPGPLSVVLSSGTTVNGGSYSIINDTGSFTYVPAAGFTGTDSFTFQVTDTLSTSTGTVNISVGTRVWYIRDVIDSNNSAGGDGRSTNPFDSIVAFNAATTNNGDIIFVFEGQTATTPHIGSITLKDGQKLWGQGIDLNVPGFGTPLVTATNKPRIRTTTLST
ncbi:MAG TPA: Ig-like domain-containing protein, partial [Thermoanaerobaculia bacterium]|nr:Ig-like domain-containing protein [Thermoanaerobaculia bacterium]